MPRQTVTHLDIKQLTAHPSNVRQHLGDIDELALSIQKHGILQPLTATEGPNGTFLLLAGHRRLGAAVRAGLPRVPVIIRHDVVDETEHVVLMLVENCQRADLHPLDRADAYAALRLRGMTNTEIARATGVTKATVGHYLALLELDLDDLDDLRGDNITVTDALAKVRQRRKEERKRQRPAGGPVGRPKGATTKPYFGDTHPLASTVRALCDHRGVPKVGSVGCGSCWETVIRSDALGAIDHQAAS